jgi:hypothetical protein
MNKREEFKKKNLQAFKNWDILIYEKLKDYQPASELVIDENGKPDVLFNNVLYYENKAEEFANEQLNQFWDNLDRYVLRPPTPESIDKHGGQFLGDLLADGISEEIEYGLYPQSIKNYNATIFGVGLGFHLSEIIEKTDCYALYIADVNMEFLYHSLSVFDWHDLYERMAEKEGVIRFAINNNTENLSAILREMIRSTNSAALDGMILYEHQSNPVLQDARLKLNRDKDLILASLGFFFDESLMLNNAFYNLKDGKSVIFRTPDTIGLKEIPVFIIGSGPSLDEALPYIKENADKAIIISAGTGIRPLLYEGIYPDFHLEQENIDVDLCVAELMETHDLTPITFLAATTIVPNIPKQFGRTIFYARGSLCPHFLFSGVTNECLSNPHNTVVNGAFSFAQDVGFQKFYLFGVDCGARDKSNHHSKHAYHFTEDAVFVKQDFNIDTRGNFGGKFLSSKGLWESRENLISAIMKHQRGYSYFNCSDGAIIEYTKPLLPKNLSLPDIEGGKEPVVQKIYEAMPVYSEDRFNNSWNEDSLIKGINHFADELIDQITNIEDFSDHAYMTDMFNFLIPERRGLTGSIEQTIAVLCRGSIFLSLNVFEFYKKRVHTDGKTIKFVELARKHLIKEIETMRIEATNQIKDLSSELQNVA